jgi:hypothetical protein
LATSAPMMMNSETIDTIFTTFSERLANSGRLALMSMPMITGTIVIAISTTTVLTIGSEMWAVVPIRSSIARLVSSGIVSGVIRLTTAVSVIDSARSPRDRYENMFDVTPPGENANTNSPTASAGVSEIMLTTPNPISGSMTI